MTQFATALKKLLQSAQSAQEQGRLLVEAVVEDAIRTLAHDFGRDPGVMLERHKEEIVARHVGDAAEGVCSGRTARGGQCTRRAVDDDGFCALHAVPKQRQTVKQVASSIDQAVMRLLTIPAGTRAAGPSL